MILFNRIRKLYRDNVPVEIKVPISKIRGRTFYHQYHDEFKCIFIHIPKTAGTSLQETLFNYSHTGHFKWDEYRAADRVKFKDYYKFAFVRNPYDRLVSAYFYLKAGGRNKYDLEWSESVLSKFPTFKSFVMEWVSESNIKDWNHFSLQSEYIFDDKGVCMVDFIGHFETLSRDFTIIASKLGVQNELSNINKSNRKQYHEYYDNDMIAVVKEVYKKDLELLGYEY